MRTIVMLLLLSIIPMTANAQIGGALDLLIVRCPFSKCFNRASIIEVAKAGMTKRLGCGPLQEGPCKAVFFGRYKIHVNVRYPSGPGHGRNVAYWLVSGTAVTTDEPYGIGVYWVDVRMAGACGAHGGPKSGRLRRQAQ